VQLPEVLDAANAEQKVAAEFCDSLKRPRNVSELTKERLRRVARKLRKDRPDWHGDAGFRVFKLATSNVKAWSGKPAQLAKTLEDSVDHLKTDRTEADILYEILAKLGLDLCVPIETKKIEGVQVHAVGGGVLLACLTEKIAKDKVIPLAEGMVAWRQALKPAGDTTCIFRDSAFADDVAKTNLAAILHQNGLSNVRSI
jgi:adenine-specific DNA-methyltransferase